MKENTMDATATRTQTEQADNALFDNLTALRTASQLRTLRPMEAARLEALEAQWTARGGRG